MFASLQSSYFQPLLVLTCIGILRPHVNQQNQFETVDMGVYRNTSTHEYMHVKNTSLLEVQNSTENQTTLYILDSTSPKERNKVTSPF